MNNKILIAVWVVALALCLWFVRFGFSDWMNPRSALEYFERNPMRPFFRITFGVIMTLLTLYSALFVTAKIRARE